MRAIRLSSALLVVGALSSPTYAHASQPARPEAVRLVDSHLDPEITWVALSDLFRGAHESCVDGRDEHGVLGTPGGDAGELVLALSAVEFLAKRPLLDHQVDQVLESELAVFGDFYLHSDTHALEHLREVLMKDPKTADYAKSIGAALPTPPAAIRELVVDALVQPDNVGCGHLKLILKNPKAYRVRPGLVRALLRSAYRRYFKGERGVSFVVLEGGHKERAVVQVDVNGPLHRDTRIPVLAPEKGGTQFFVHHPQVADYLRVEQVRVLLAREPWLIRLDVTEARIMTTMRDLADRQLQETLKRLAAGLPVYRLHFEPSGAHTLDATGVVPKSEFSRLSH